MATMITSFLSQIWQGIWSIPVFDLGINFGQLSLGCMVITISFILYFFTKPQTTYVLVVLVCFGLHETILHLIESIRLALVAFTI